MVFKDSELIAQEDHELNYVLKKYEKRQTKGNRALMRQFLKKFRQEPTYTPHKRRDFYRYVEATRCFDQLENRKR